MGAFLGQQLDKKLKTICYVSKTLVEAQIRAFGGGLRTREVPALHLGEQGHYLHRSCGLEIHVLQERGQTMTHTMGAAPSRIRLVDQRQEGQRELGGRPLITSACSRCRRHRRLIPR